MDGDGVDVLVVDRDVRYSAPTAATVRCQSAPALTSTLLLCTSVRCFRGRRSARSNAYRTTRSTPCAVFSDTSVAISWGVPTRIAPPLPTYGPSVPSRTTTKSTSPGDDNGVVTVGYTTVGRRFT